MSYVALYRKFRPDSFEDVKGQDAIVTTLQNQIKAERTGHAYLFCGTRGTGKTTVAKILAKAVNCESPRNGSPCNECATCRAIQNGTSLNVIEIDAASNNGVDNIREIVEEVKYSPTSGKYKVYIIDEVHMLSGGAFNALLKTLEEPPAYAMFILATTEVHKIPITILSRCQRYDFKRITVDCISDRLRELMDKEGLAAEDKALAYIARMADGAMRDALSLLDQCIAFYPDKTLAYDDVLQVLGNVDIEVFARLLRYVREGMVAECISLVDEIVLAGRDLSQFVIDFTWYLRNLLLLCVSDETDDILEVSADQRKLLQHEAEAVDSNALMRYIRIFSELSNQIKYATQKRVMLEISLVKLCRPQMEQDVSSLAQRLAEMEKRLESGEFTVKSELNQNPDISKTEKKSGEITQAQKLQLEKAITEDIREVSLKWNMILQKLPQLVRTVLISAKPSTGSGNELLIVFEHMIDKHLIDSGNHLGEIKKAVEAVIGKEVEVKTILAGDDGATESFVDLTKLIKKIPIEYVDE